MTLRSYLGILVAAGVLPLSILTMAVGVTFVRQQHATVDRGISDTVTGLAALVQNELETSIKSLETLATSERLDTDDLPAFYEQARRVREHHRWSTIGLIDATGHHRLNLARPLGEALPDVRDREYFQQVVATGGPFVSDLLTGRATATTDLGVAVPVFRGGQLAYVLFAGLDPVRFTELFTQLGLPGQAVARVIGRDGRVIARSLDHAGTVGHPVSPEYLAQVGGQSHGLAEAIVPGGVALRTAYRRMPSTGWLVDVGLPADALTAPVRRIAWLATGASGLLVLGTFALAVILARRMARDIQALSAVAAGIEQRRSTPPSTRVHVAELDGVRQFMLKADETRRGREHERAVLLASERAARAEAEALNRAKDQFLAMLGHELRNPLGAIVSATSLLKRVDPGTPTSERARAIIERQGQHLSRLVDDLLDVGRMTSGKVTLVREPLDLGDLTASTVSMWRASGRLEHHQVTMDVSSVWVDGDRTRLEQVVGNILTNALKYTPAGGTVTVTAAQEDGDAVLRIRDTGIGITSHMVPRVFDLFVQGETGLARADGGLGVGLTLVRRLVELHGGRVTAESDGEGRGSTFAVRIPVMANPAAGPPPERPARRSPAALRLRVLVVEDDDAARETLRASLALGGHDVIEAVDGPSAVELEAQTRPDVVLIDVGLPGFNGYEVARRLRSRSRTDLRLIAVTGDGLPDGRARAAEAGFDGYLVKPVDPDTLAAALSPRGAPLPRSLGAMARAYDPVEDAVQERRRSRRLRQEAAAARGCTRRLIDARRRAPAVGAAREDAGAR